MKNLYKISAFALLITACAEDLDQFPAKQIQADALEDVGPVLNAAYHYHTGTCTPLAMMGDFRADNMKMDEEPYPAFDRFNADLSGGDLVEQFFRPFYSNLYKSIQSANTVISLSSDDTQIAEAKFVRALSYFKLVLAFGDVSVIPVSSLSLEDESFWGRQPSADVYNDVIIPDLQDAKAGLDNSELANGRASSIAAQGLLGKVYMHMGNFNSAATEFAGVVSGAAAAGVSTEADFANAVSDGNSEILFATLRSTTIPDVYTAGTEFPGWFSGGDTKSLSPLDSDLSDAFDAIEVAAGATDARRVLTLSEGGAFEFGVKYSGGLEQDWIELRLSDVLLMNAEALNENTDSDAAREAALDLLDPIRTRAGLNALDHTTLNTQALVRQAIYDERRVELAFEGHRWFDLVRTGTANAEMGVTIDPNYHVFPIPNSEVSASNGVITQNSGY